MTTPSIKRIFPLFLAAFAICATAGIQRAFAAGNSAAGGQTAGAVGPSVNTSNNPPLQAPGSAANSVDWMNTDKYQACGQGCIYQKANETLSLQALYLLNKQQALGDIAHDPTRTQADEDQLRAELQPIYCGSGDSVDTCYQNYLIMTVPVLEKIKIAIATNETSARILQSGTGATPDPVYVSSQQIPNKLPQTPEVPHVAEIYTRMKTLPPVENYAQWISENQPYKPKLEDFPLYTTPYRDPAHPEAGQFTIIVTNPDGSIQYDKKAYKTAVDNFYKKNPHPEVDAQVSDEYKTLKTRRPGIIPGFYTVDKKGQPVDHSLSYQSYIKSENEMVGAANTVLGRPDFNKVPAQSKTPATHPNHAPSPNPQGSGRTLASGTAAKTPASNPNALTDPPSTSNLYSNTTRAPSGTSAPTYTQKLDANGEAERVKPVPVPVNNSNTLTVDYAPTQLDEDISGAIKSIDP